MRKGIVIIISLLFHLNVFGQETVQWASDIMFVTSELSPLQYSAGQVLNSPNVYPKGGESPNAWRPSKPDADQYVVVQFDKTVHAQQIAIAETENPGSVSKVYAYDSLDNEYLLFDLNARPIPLESRLLNLFFEKTPYRIAYIRVDMACSSVPGYNSIDAIGISSSNIPISVLIELAPNVNENLSTEKLGASVNSQYIEHSPILSPDGKTLYFSRRAHPDNVGGVDDYEDIWYSELDEATGEWLPAKNIGPPLNTRGANFICSITQQDGETVLLLGNRYEKRGRMAQGISMSKSKGDGKWEKPTNLTIENDYNYSDKADFFMTQAGDAIILAAERDDTYGDRDLYISFKNARGEWSEPLNLGPDVNSADTESAAFLDADNETLYFTSKGFRGYGGEDIYVSKRLDLSWQSWSAPENLGKGVNGPGDDTYFYTPATGSHSYFTKGSSDENTDIYRFRTDELFIEVEDVEPDAPIVVVVGDDQPTIPIVDEVPIVPVVEEVFITIIGKVLDSRTSEPLTANVIVERLPDGLKIGQTLTDSDGFFSFRLRPGARYGFLGEKEYYIAKSENVDLNNIIESTTITRDLFLTPIEKGAAIVLNNIFFEFDRAQLTTSSYAELNRILDLMRDNKIRKIEISGHTDSVGDHDYNVSLSQRRARAVYNFFKLHNIIESRLVSIGYGEANPMFPNTTAESRRQNRRVEFKILE